MLDSLTGGSWTSFSFAFLVVLDGCFASSLAAFFFPTPTVSFQSHFPGLTNSFENDHQALMGFEAQGVT